MIIKKIIASFDRSPYRVEIEVGKSYNKKSVLRIGRVLIGRKENEYAFELFDSLASDAEPFAYIRTHNYIILFDK